MNFFDAIYVTSILQIHDIASLGHTHFVCTSNDRWIVWPTLILSYVEHIYSRKCVFLRQCGPFEIFEVSLVTLTKVVIIIP